MPALDDKAIFVLIKADIAADLSKGEISLGSGAIRVWRNGLPIMNRLPKIDSTTDIGHYSVEYSYFGDFTSEEIYRDSTARGHDRKFSFVFQIDSLLSIRGKPFPNSLIHAIGEFKGL